MIDENRHDPEDYYPRHMVGELERALKTSRVVNLIGPRQVGKTTLVRDLFRPGHYATLDNPGLLEAVDEDPAGQLAALLAQAGDGPLVIDEAQRSKALPLAIKEVVDRTPRRKGRIILTGSSNVFRTAAVADALPGRISTLTLGPLSLAETRKVPPSRLLDWAVGDDPDLAAIDTPEILSREQCIDIVLRGGFPEPYELELRDGHRLYREYVSAIVERDVADIIRIRKTDKLRRLIDQLAARTAQPINVSNLASRLQLHRQTVEQHVDVLVRLSLLDQLGAWASGEPGREVKAPKFHYIDTGMCSALRSLTPSNFVPGSPGATALGGLLESFVLGQVRLSLPFQSTEHRLYHWRHRDNREVDIVAETGTNLVAMEVKAASGVSKADFKHLEWFRTNPANNWRVTGIVFYLGERMLSFGDRLFALPVSSLWSDVSP